MMLSKILEIIENELNMKIEDSSANGLQVGKDKEIKKLGLAVDSNLDTFRKAKERGCDALIAHHGLIWKDSEQAVTGSKFERISFLIKNDIALAAYHLPLDAHPKIGNNAVIAELLNMKNLKPFDVGFSGQLRKETGAEALAVELGKALNAKCTVFPFGKPVFSSVAIISGFGGKDVEQASKIADCFITGEIMYGVKQLAKDLKTNVITAGHYETEATGIKALTHFLNKRTSVQMEFIE